MKSRSKHTPNRRKAPIKSPKRGERRLTTEEETTLRAKSAGQFSDSRAVVLSNTPTISRDRLRAIQVEAGKFLWQHSMREIERFMPAAIAARARDLTQELKDFAGWYWGVVGRATGHLAYLLAQAIVFERPLEKKQMEWVRAKACEFALERLSPEAVKNWLSFTISDPVRAPKETGFEERLDRVMAVVRSMGHFDDWEVSHTLSLARAMFGAHATKLTEREKKIWVVIQRGSEGPEYCRELDNAGIEPLRSGVWKDCPSRKYASVYREGELWTHRIQDEKSKVRRKAELAGLASE